MTDIVKIADVGHVRTITLNRPEKKNALSDALAWGVIAAVEDAARTDDVWVVALTGSGDAFCSGLDLSGSERSSPLSRQSAQLDDISWVGNFLRRSENGATNRSSEASMGSPWGRASVSPWRPTSA